MSYTDPGDEQPDDTEQRIERILSEVGWPLAGLLFTPGITVTLTTTSDPPG